MAIDLLIYADGKRQWQTAGSLVVFGAETIGRAKVLAGLHILEECNKLLQQNLPYNQNALAQEFIFDYLIDCVRILIFFEGYMKAELILKNFCVHNINKEGAYQHLTTLANQQKKRPIDLGEIQLVEPFIVDTQANTIEHGGIKETTLSINILLGPKYRLHYQLDDILIEDIKYFNNLRNKLHFNHTAEFQLSTAFIDRLKRVRTFLDITLERWLRKPSDK